MNEQLLAEVYLRRAQGEPLRTVAGTRERVLAKAAALARALGQPVVVVLGDERTAVRVSATGRVKS